MTAWGRVLRGLAALGAWLLISAATALAQTYPTKPVRLIVGFTPGTTVDILARVLGQKLAQMWGQQVVIENVPGASSTIAANGVARAPADGYTLMFATTSIVVSPSLYKKLAYDVDRDFSPITLVAYVPNVLVVHASLPVKDIRGLIALARSKPSQLNYASSGKGSASHLNTELFKAMAKVNIVEIPYKSSAQALTDVMSGEVLLNYPSIAAVLPHIRSGRVKALAVSGATRSQAAPEIPAMAEFLPGYEASAWYGIVVPAGTPAPLISRLNTDIVRVVKTVETAQKMAGEGAELIGSSVEEFGRLMRSDRDKWQRLIRQLNIPLEG